MRPEALLISSLGGIVNQPWTLAEPRSAHTASKDPLAGGQCELSGTRPAAGRPASPLLTPQDSFTQKCSWTTNAAPRNVLYSMNVSHGSQQNNNSELALLLGVPVLLGCCLSSPPPLGRRLHCIRSLLLYVLTENVATSTHSAHESIFPQRRSTSAIWRSSRKTSQSWNCGH